MTVCDVCQAGIVRDSHGYWKHITPTEYAGMHPAAPRTSMCDECGTPLRCLCPGTVHDHVHDDQGIPWCPELLAEAV